MSSREILPYGRQEIDKDDIRHVVEVLNTDFLTTGSLVNNSCGMAPQFRLN